MWSAAVHAVLESVRCSSETVLGLLSNKGGVTGRDGPGSVQPQTSRIPSRRWGSCSLSPKFRMAQNQPESKSERDISELETTVCPVCKQLKLADQACQSAICQEIRKKQSA